MFSNCQSCQLKASQHSKREFHGKNILGSYLLTYNRFYECLNVFHVNFKHAFIARNFNVFLFYFAFRHFWIKTKAPYSHKFWALLPSKTFNSVPFFGFSSWPSVVVSSPSFFPGFEANVSDINVKYPSRSNASSFTLVQNEFSFIFVAWIYNHWWQLVLLIE